MDGSKESKMPGNYSKSQILNNTLFNYANLFIQMGASVFILRMLYLNLDEGLFGFWQLLWVIFGYSLLLDFGFGLSIQKYAAEYVVTKNVSKFNELLSSVIVTYMLMALLIIVFTIVSGLNLQTLFAVEGASQERLDYYLVVYLAFGIGSALAFPTGIFMEILHGLGRIDLRSKLRIFQTIVTFIIVFLVTRFEGSLLELTFAYMLTIIGINLSACFLTFKNIKGLKISVRHFSIKNVKTIASFSIFAYMTIFSKMVIFKTDQILLGVMLSMSAVASYHAGSRLSILMSDLSTRFQESLAPVAAALYKAGETEKLRWTMFRSSRFAAFITTLFFVIVIILLKPILYFWLEIEEDSHEIYGIAYVMIFSIYIITLFRSASDRFMLMANEHKYLAKIAVAEGVANLILSVILIKIMGVVGVAFGTLIPNIIISLFVFFPFMCKFGKFRKVNFIRQVYIPVLLNAVPAAVVIFAFITYVFPVHDLSSWGGLEGFLKLSCVSIVAGMVYLLTSYFVLDQAEKEKITNAFNRFRRQNS